MLSEEEKTRIRATRKIMHDKFAQAVDITADQFDPEVLSKQAYNILTKEREQVIFKLLGFDSRWGKVEVDHCNGRDSIMTEQLKRLAGPVIDDWIAKEIAPALEKAARLHFTEQKVLQAIQSEFINSFNYRLREMVRAHAEKAASEYAAKLAAEFTEAVSMVEPEETPETA